MLPVWVESGYDGGRFAGWVPSVPGVLAVADSHVRAISLAVTNTARVRGWLEAHDDEAGIPRLWRAELAGDVEATTRDDGYEVNATLPDRPAGRGRRRGRDRDPAPRLGPRGPARRCRPDRRARGDGRPAADERRARRAAPGRGAAPRRRARRSWLLGRLPGGGPATRGRWTACRSRSAGGVAGVGRGPARDARPRATTAPRPRIATARRGRWPRSCAGIQAHGFDHLWELERRLVRADGTRDRIEVVLDRFPETGQVVGLLRSVGWDLRASGARLARARAPGHDGVRDRMGRRPADRDGALDLGRGAERADRHGRRRSRLPGSRGGGADDAPPHRRPGARPVLAAATPGLEPWYRKLGFVPDPHALFRPRRRG